MGKRIDTVSLRFFNVGSLIYENFRAAFIGVNDKKQADEHLENGQNATKGHINSRVNQF